jgi:branched-chain amino acid transport system substrate-binding protein
MSLDEQRVSSILSALLFCLTLSVPCAAFEPVKVAAIFAKTGLASHTDAFALRGVALAVEEINENGGLLGHPVQLIEIDNQSTPLGSKQAAKTALNLGVTAVIGCCWSSHSLAMAPLLQEASVPMISPLSTNPEVTRVGDYIFRVCFVDSFQGQVMARFAIEDLHARSAVVLINVSSPYSMDLSDFFIKSFTAAGGQVLWKGKYREKAVDFSEILDEVRRHAPDAVFLPGYAPDSALIIRQATANGHTDPLPRRRRMGPQDVRDWRSGHERQILLLSLEPRGRFPPKSEFDGKVSQKVRRGDEVGRRRPGV